MTDKPIAGIDIAKEWLDICVNGTGVERLADGAETEGAGLGIATAMTRAQRQKRAF